MSTSIQNPFMLGSSFKNRPPEAWISKTTSSMMPVRTFFCLAALNRANLEPTSSRMTTLPLLFIIGRPLPSNTSCCCGHSIHGKLYCCAAVATDILPAEATAAAFAALAICSSRASRMLIHLEKFCVLSLPVLELMGINSAGIPNVSRSHKSLVGVPECGDDATIDAV